MGYSIIKKAKEKLPFYKYFFTPMFAAHPETALQHYANAGERIFGRYLVDFDKAVEAAGEKWL